MLGTSVGGDRYKKFNYKKIVQSSLNSAIRRFNSGIKQQTGKSPLEHAIAYAEEKNPEMKNLEKNLVHLLLKELIQQFV